MVTKRVLYSAGAMYWDEPTTLELVMIILNYVACIPVLLSVGIFSIYHLVSLMRNTTTIDGWEKDKAAIMVKRGKTREVKFPYDLGRRRNIESILGTKRSLWCCPTRTPGSGLKYELSNTEGNEWLPNDSESESDNDQNGDVAHNSSPWTYENGSLNPALRSSNSELSELRSRRRRAPQNKVSGASPLPPYHPDYREDGQPEQYFEDTGSSGEEYTKLGKVHVRRGSEGYEVREEGREEMLRRYLEEQGEDPDRYLRYIPQPDEDSESDDDDDVPLAYHKGKEDVKTK
jgi:palmitoyltransferase